MENDLTTRQEFTPSEVIVNATAQAHLLMDIVTKTKCYQEISGKKYLQVEAWETIGAFNRTHAETESITEIVRDGDVIGYRARVQLWKDGAVVGGAIMPCFFTENCCKGKEGDAKHKACMSAAQTFATSKAYRMNFSYVAILAGYQPMPAEEITTDMAVVIDKSQHWCKEHDTQFFKKGKMKSHAHPIGDTGEWCHEHTPEIKTAPPKKDRQVDKGTGEITKETPPAGSAVDMEWLIEIVNKTKWDVLKYIKDNFKADASGNLGEIVARLTDTQKGQLCKEAQEREDLNK